MQAKHAAHGAKDRYNIYSFPHKGLRALMQQTLYSVGSCDWIDPVDVEAALTEVRAMMELMYGHLHHENEFLHPAMEERRPGSTGTALIDHEQHTLAIKALLTDADEIAQAAVSARPALGYRFYTRLALFVAENLEHMVMEETDHNEVLWSCYSDEEIMAIEQRLVAAIPPQRKVGFLRWMVPAMNASERAVMLRGIRAGMPAEAFDGLLSEIRALLSERDWAKLSAALGCAAGTTRADVEFLR